MNESDLEEFWGPQIETECAPMIADEFWDSLPEMARDVDLVVVGRPVAVRERFASFARSVVAVVDVAIDEVIQGQPVTRDDGLIELELYYAAPPPADLGLPDNRHLFFLRNVAAVNEAHGEPFRDTDPYSYNLPSLYQNVLVEIGGKVFIPAESRIMRMEWNDFPTQLQGRSFEDILSVVRRAEDGSGASARAAIAMIFAC